MGSIRNECWMSGLSKDFYTGNKFFQVYLTLNITVYLILPIPKHANRVSTAVQMTKSFNIVKIVLAHVAV